MAENEKSDDMSGQMLEQAAENIKKHFPEEPAVAEVADLIVMSDRYRQSDMAIIHESIDKLSVAVIGNGKPDGSMMWRLKESERVALEALAIAKDNKLKSEKGKTAYRVLVWAGTIILGAVLVAGLRSIFI